MSQENELDFDFDFGPVVNGISKITDAWEAMTNTFKKSDKKIDDSFNNLNTSQKGVKEENKKTSETMGLSLTKLLGIVGLLSAGFVAVKGALGKMPEIGMALGAAGDIFMRNFLNPIRRELIPLLNKLLSWVQENRGNFVQWGQIVLNVVKVVWQVFKQLAEVIISIGRTIKTELESVFGGFTNSFTNTIQLIVFKITVLMNFLLIMLRPVFEMIGKIISRIVVGASAIWEGFMEGASGVIEIINEIINDIVSLVNELLGGAEGASSFFDFFKRIGVILGKVFKIIFRIIRLIFVLLKPVIKLLFYLGKVIAGILVSAFEMVVDIVDDVISIFESMGSAVDFVIRTGKKIAKWFDDNLVNPIKKAVSAISGFIGKIFDKVTETIKGTIDWIKNAIRKVTEFLGLASDSTEAANELNKRTERLKREGKFSKEIERGEAAERTRASRKAIKEGKVSVELGRRGGSYNNINQSNNMTINVNESETPKETAQNVFNKLLEKQSSFSKELEMAAIASGEND